MSVEFLNNLVKTQSKNIDDWIAAYSNRVQLPLFTSLDIRNSGFKIAHVDANLFPAGFNNISSAAEKQAANFLSQYIKKYYGNIRKVLLIPENFTRNLKYLESLDKLSGIISSAGYEVQKGLPDITAPIQLSAPANFEISPLQLNGNAVATTSNWQPDLIILNNDLTTGVPAILNECKQPIIPTPDFGWHKRRKHKHFAAYNKIAQDFAAEFKFDPWLITTYFENCGTINFREKTGLACLARQVDHIIQVTKQKYEEYQINAEPYVFIKADMGTYGLGVMTAHSSEEILNINKKHRHSMNVIKSGVHNTEIMIQEGIPTIEMEDGHPAESLIYMVAGRIVGNIKRWNVDHDHKANLNAHGMKLASDNPGEYDIKNVISKLAAIAITREMDV